MHCVRCKTEMKKNNLRGVLVDHCSTCNGVWLDAGELEALEKGMRKPEHEIKQEHRQETMAERQRGVEIMGRCPKCQEGQVNERLMDGMVIDYCGSCHGLFFDHGELKQIVENRQQGFFTRLTKNLFGA